MKKALFLAAAAAVFLLGWLIDDLLSGEERGVQACVEQAAAAVEDESFPALEALLAAEFAYSSPVPMVGSGDLDRLRSRLAAAWERIEILSISIGGWTVQVEGEGASARLEGNAKIAVPEIVRFAIYRFEVRMRLRKIEGRWKILSAEIPALTLGL